MLRNPAENVDNASDIIVIGAGPAGLGAAYVLSGSGLAPVVMEQSGAIGGIARTENYRGYLFDIGGHRFFTKIKSVQCLWENLLGSDLLQVNRSSRIYYKNRFIDYPLGLINLVSTLGLGEGLQILYSYGYARLQPDRPDDTFEQWICNRFGRRLYTDFFKQYTEKIWGLPCREIPAEWAHQRIRGLSLKEAALDVLGFRRKAKSLTRSFFYPLKGPGMMWQRLWREIQQHGGRLALNTTVVQLSHNGQRITQVVCRSGNLSQKLSAGQVVSSMPIRDLVQCLDPPAPDHIRAAANALTHRAFIMVGLIIDRKDLFPDQWLYINTHRLKVGRIQNFKNWSPHMVPDPGATSIGMEYFCNAHDRLWSKSDAQLIDLASSELQILGLSQGAKITDAVVFRQPAAYPVYTHDYTRHLQQLLAYLKRFKNLQTIGRNGLHRYNNMDHALYTGMLAAQNALGGEHDLRRVNGDTDYLETAWRCQAANE